MNDTPVLIKLNNAEAITLFELLSRITESAPDELFQHLAEERVLSKILADLEKNLAEPLQPDYIEILKEARETVNKG